uniref:Zmp:0000001267 n=1 Tax=Sinocyclocheilus grahami TaxID=75366 RepID=A0A672LZ63_SINGR
IKRKKAGKEKLTLRQELGLTSAVSLVAGIMIGSGIFMSPHDILRIYGPCPAFFVAFTTMFVMKPFGIIAGSLSFAKYALAPFYPGSCVLVIATANVLNIRFTINAQAVFIVAKFVGLMIIVIGGIITLLQGNYGSLYNLESAFADTKLGISTVGMYNLNNVTEEVNLPRALMIAIPMVTMLYLLVNVSYLVVMTPTEMISSSAVAVTWGNKVLGGWGWVMSIAAALSALSSLNGSFFSGGRVCYVAAREGHMPDILAMAHMCRLTPSPALIFNTIIALIALILGDFQAIVNYFSFAAWFFYGITVSGLNKLTFNHCLSIYPFKVPIIIPILVLLAAVFLVLAPIIDDPQIEYLYVILFMLSSIVIYIPFIHLKLFPGLLNKLTVFLQLFLEVAPTAKNL